MAEQTLDTLTSQENEQEQTSETRKAEIAQLLTKLRTASSFESVAIASKVRRLVTATPSAEFGIKSR